MANFLVHKDELFTLMTASSSLHIQKYSCRFLDNLIIFSFLILVGTTIANTVAQVKAVNYSSSTKQNAI